MRCVESVSASIGECNGEGRGGVPLKGESHWCGMAANRSILSLGRGEFLG